MSPRRRKKRPTFACPHCGAPVREGASACRSCGSDAGTGWSRSAYLAEHEDPGDFDYDGFLLEEFGPSAGGSARRALRRWGLRVLVAILAGGLLLILWRF